MKKSLIKKEYDKKLKLIKHYNQKYYSNNISEITDSEYDSLKNEILILEKKHKFLQNKD